MGSVSVEDHGSGTSFSFAPSRPYNNAAHSIEPSPRGKTWATAHMDALSQRKRCVREDPGPSSEHSAFYDAEEGTSGTQSASGTSSTHTTQGPIMSPLQGLHDAMGGTRLSWPFPHEGFNGPGGSPRHVVGGRHTAHPLLKQYNSPPTTHPYLHRISPKCSLQSFSDFDGNELEGDE